MKDALADSGFFVLRTPLLPFEELERFGAGLETPGRLEDEQQLAQALADDRERLRERLTELIERPAVRDALFVASPDLEASLATWEREPDSARGGKVERALVRYFERMAGRATPFGLFAGCSVGRIDERTRLTLEPVERARRHSRLDQDYLDALLVALEGDAELRRELVFRPNSSLYRAAGQFRYAEKRMDGRRRSHHLAAVDDSVHLRAALEHALDGIRPAELAQALVSDDVALEHAEHYVDDLIEGQVLVPELDIPVTGPEPLDTLAAELAGHRASEQIGRRLGEVRADLAALDAGGIGAKPERYRQIAARLEELPAEPELGRLFQVDMHKPAPDATLGRAVIEELELGARLLHRISPASPARELQTFRERFIERFEGREVPLLEALDDDTGVGFPEPDAIGAAPLLEGLLPPPVTDAPGEWRERDRLLLRRLMDAVADGQRSIELGQDDLDALAVADSPPLPDALAVSAVLAASSVDALDAGEFRLHLQAAAGPSGARLMGRFTHGDPELRQRVEEHLRAEEALRPDAVFAEIVHLPEGRIGNISCRPVLREHEIPYLGRSSAQAERQIPAGDLMVSVSGHPATSPYGESIVLRSRRLGRTVLPRLTTAHNFGWRTVPLYRFLCLLQNQEPAVRAWSWGPLESAPFLPRVEAGRLVLSLARWRLDRDELRALLVGDAGGRFVAAQLLRERRGLPRLVAIQDVDNMLPVDFDNVLSVEAFTGILGGREEATLVELWPPPEELCAHGPEGHFLHELVVPFVRRHPARASVDEGPAAKVADAAGAVPARVLPPGSDWLYAKLYAGRAAADRILPDVVAPLVDEVMASGAADSWFFIRYGDPHEHLRLRFHGEPRALREEVQPRVEAALAGVVREGRAWRLTFDTYERELERYGGPNAIELAERIFRADSDTVLELLSMFEGGDRGAGERWRMALCGASVLMADLGLEERERIELLRRLRDSYGREHRVDADYTRRLGGRLREHRRSLEPLVVPGDDVPDDLQPGVAALRARSARLRPLVGELDALERTGALTTSRASLTASFVHMYVNRLARSAPRMHELAIYDFLLRLYESRAARARHATAPRT